MNKMKILVTFANTYDMTRDGGGKGMTLNYFFWGDNGELMSAQDDLSGGAVGVQRAKCSMNFEDREKISFVPGVYEAEMGMKVGSDGKPILVVQDIVRFVGKVDMKLLNPNPAK